MTQPIRLPNLSWPAAVLLGLLVPVLGLPPVRVASAQPAFEPTDPALVRLADEPLKLEGIGLTLTPPVDATASTNTRGGRVTTSLRLPDDRGVIGVQNLPNPEGTSVIQIEQQVIVDLLGLPPTTTGLTIDSQVQTGRGQLLGRSPVITTPDRIVRPFYFRLEELGEVTFRGVAVVPITPTEHAMFNLVTLEADFDLARASFEAMLGTVTVADSAAIDQKRGIAISAGVNLLDTLTRADFDAVVADVPEQFERIYRPVPGGADADEVEVGYRRIKAWVGSRDDLTRREPGNKPGEKDGYLLRIDGLVFLDDNRRADSRAIYYLSRDRRQEAWTVEMAIRPTDPTRASAKPEVWTEIGARFGNSMTVQIDHAGKSSHTARPLIEGEGYISRLEAYLLPQLLIRAGEPGEYAFYAYDQSAEANRLRFVDLAEAEDRPGVWNVTTRRVNEQTEAAEYNQYGRLIRAESSDGLIKRPIEFERLYRIWESKGLPLD